MMNTKTIWLNATVLALTATLMCGTVFGQVRDVTPQYEELHEVTLLGFPTVIKHLSESYDVSKKQAAALAEIGAVRKSHMLQRKTLYMKSRTLADDKFEQAKIKLTESIEQANIASWTKAEKLLNEKQIARLKQIRTQRIRVDALLNPKVISALKIDDKQIKAINDSKATFAESMVALKAKQRTKMREILSTGLDRERMLAQNELNKKENKDAKDAFEAQVYKTILNKDQRTQFNQMRGEKFEFKLDYDFQKLNLKWRSAPASKPDSAGPAKK